ncbi:MAG: glycosyltransferase family 2 protein [Cyclobacteriaceae bacterium]|nr:glycosyltransferase family 2 protein [Cyclobacteriaceae bacterium]
MSLISIIIPCYNQGQFLVETLNSIKILKDGGIADVLIVNDGSTDLLTKQVLGNVEREGWHVIHQPNMGLAKARNSGIQRASTKYILPLDSDNIIIPDFVKRAIQILENDNHVDIVYSDCIFFGEMEGYQQVGDFDACKLIDDNYIDACAVYRKTLWDCLGGYDADMPAMGHEDWDFWIRAMMNKKKFSYVAMAGFKYRVRKNSMLRSLTDNDAQMNRHYIYNKHNYPLMESIRMNYTPQDKNFKKKYFDLKNQLKRNKIKNVIKIILGMEFY